MTPDQDVALPPSWIAARLSDLADIRLGKMLSPKAYLPGLVVRPYLRNENVRWGTIDLSVVKEMGFKNEELERYEVKPGDLLVCEGGEPGRCALYQGSPRSLMYQKALHRVRPYGDGMSAALLQFWIQHMAISGRLSPKIAQTTIQHLPLERFQSIAVPLPPFREQKRIVFEIEKQLTRIDAAVITLERTKRQLARYRASVLKAACEGRLVPTEAALARAEGRDYESGEELLRRILREGGAQQDGRSRDRAEADRPSDNRLLECQKGWAWSTLRIIADLKGGVTKGQRRRPGETTRLVPYLRVANVQRGFLDLAEIKEIEATEAEIDELRLQPGDVLFNEGGDRDKLGRGWVWQGQLPTCVHQNHVFRARVIEGLIDPKFLSWYGNSLGQAYFLAEGKQTTNLASINLTKLGALPVPIPPTLEQHRIVAEVELQLSVADEIAATVDTSLTRAARLRQSILSRAFEGKLVPQDPNDEPASVLLERIRKEREALRDEAYSAGDGSRRGTTRTKRPKKGRPR